MTTTSKSTNRCTCPNPERRVIHLNPDCPYYGDRSKYETAREEARTKRIEETKRT